MARNTKIGAEQTRQQILSAARKVFYACGVSRSTLEQIAQVAGVTRGAVYWHFENKEDLFFAMREQVTLPLIDQVDAVLGDDTLPDPLEGIEHALQRLLDMLATDARAREVFEIVRFRCEYVSGFVGVHQTMLRSHEDFRCQLEAAYRRAAQNGLLRQGLDPAVLARDTKMFTLGLIDSFLADPSDDQAAAAPRMIATHIALRRP